MNLRIFLGLESMRSSYNYDSIVSTSLLDHLRTKYFISTKFDLQVPQPSQCPFDPILGFFCLFFNTIEIGLHLPFSLNESILPSMVGNITFPIGINSWHYLIVFIGKCRHINITSTYTCIVTCFLLCNRRSSYYLVARGALRPVVPLSTIRVVRNASSSWVQFKIGGSTLPGRHIISTTPLPSNQIKRYIKCFN